MISSFRKAALLSSALVLAGCALTGLAAAPAHAQANVVFTGGSGTPLSATVLNPITYTITKTTGQVSPFFSLVGTGDFAQFSFPPFSGSLTFTINGGAPLTLDRLTSGFNSDFYYGNEVTANDGYFFGTSSLPGLVAGDIVVLNAGTLVSTGNYANAAPASGTYNTFVFDTLGARISGNGVSAAAAVPEPSEYAAAGMFGATLLFGMVKARRKKAIVAA